MRAIAIVVFTLVAGFLIMQVAIFKSREEALNQEFQTTKEKLEKATVARDELKEKLRNYDQPANIEQAVREQFNYRRPDEKVLIIIPPHESTTPRTN